MIDQGMRVVNPFNRSDVDWTSGDSRWGDVYSKFDLYLLIISTFSSQLA